VAAERAARRPHLVWVYTQALLHALDAATWLETSRELGRIGWDVTLVTGDPPGTPSPEGVRLVALGKTGLYLLGQAAFHARVVWGLLSRRGPVDVVLFHEMSAPWLLPLAVAGRAARRARPLYVMDTRTLPMVSAERASRRDRVRDAFYGWMNRLANRLADGRTAITPRMAEALGVPEGRLLGTWPSAVDPSRFSRARARRRWPAPEAGEPVRLVYVGNLAPERNLVGLSRVVAEAGERGMAFVLTAVGSGDGEAELRALAERLDGRLRVLPPVPHDGVPEVLAEAHIGVLPFPDEERFRVSSPIKLFEYMGAGLPVLATRIACHTDVVGDGDYAFWAEDPTDDGLLGALESAWRARGALSEMGERAARAAQDYTWAASAARLAAALERVLALRAPARGRQAERSGAP
jgi:glycosyltransferase involved in cell wall biosynthesis